MHACGNAVFIIFKVLFSDVSILDGKALNLENVLDFQGFFLSSL